MSSELDRTELYSEIYDSMNNAQHACEDEIKSPKGGKKSDAGKLRYDLIEPEFLEGLATILTHGASKYGDKNWQGLEPYRVERALMTHLNNFRKGEKIDKDAPNQHNMFAVAVNAMFLWWLDTNGEN